MDMRSDVLALQHAAGNRAVAGLLDSRVAAGRETNRYEWEADRVADAVVNENAAATRPAVALTAPAIIQRQDRRTGPAPPTKLPAQEEPSAERDLELWKKALKETLKRVGKDYALPAFAETPVGKAIGKFLESAPGKVVAAAGVVGAATGAIVANALAEAASSEQKSRVPSEPSLFSIGGTLDPLAMKSVSILGVEVAPPSSSASKPPAKSAGKQTPATPSGAPPSKRPTLDHAAIDRLLLSWLTWNLERREDVLQRGLAAAARLQPPGVPLDTPTAFKIWLEIVGGRAPQPAKRKPAPPAAPRSSRWYPQLKRDETSTHPPAPDRSSIEGVFNSPGRALTPPLRELMESRFGADFGDVRLHTDRPAGESAKALNAAAYTFGRDIVFATGRHSPGTNSGLQLLAHELAHVVQQRRGGSLRSNGWQSRHLERAADVASQQVSRGDRAVHVKGASGARVALQPDPPTFGNLEGDAPDPRWAGRRVQLVQQKGIWYEQAPNLPRWRARGNYAFVVQGGKLWAVRESITRDQNPGHREAAQGGRVEFAGTIRFGRNASGRGVLREWSNASGHFLPVRAFAGAAGLPMDKFTPFEGPRTWEGPQAQLPVYQPGSSAGSPPAGGAGPSTPESKTTPQQSASRRQSRGATGTGSALTRGRALLAFEAGKVLLGWAGDLIQEAEPRRALMHAEGEVQGKLLRNPGWGVVITLIWTRYTAIGSAKGNVPTTKWRFDRLETSVSQSERKGTFIKTIPPNIEEKRQSFWVPPLPASELPPEQSGVRPHDLPLPDVDSFNLHVAAKMLLERGQASLRTKDSAQFQTGFAEWLQEKNRWNERISTEIGKLDEKWDQSERRKLSDVRDWFNEEAAKILQGSVKSRSKGPSRKHL